MKTSKTFYQNGKFLFLEGDGWPEEPEYGKLTSDTLEKDKHRAIQYADDLKGALKKAVEFEDQKAILSLVVSKVFPRDITEGLYSIPEQKVEIVTFKNDKDADVASGYSHPPVRVARIVQKEVVSHPTIRKTLQMCKDSVVRLRGFVDYDDYLRQDGDGHHLTVLDEATELYASQFKEESNLLKEEKADLSNTIRAKNTLLDEYEQEIDRLQDQSATIKELVELLEKVKANGIHRGPNCYSLLDEIESALSKAKSLNVKEPEFTEDQRKELIEAFKDWEEEGDKDHECEYMGVHVDGVELCGHCGKVIWSKEVEQEVQSDVKEGDKVKKTLNMCKDEVAQNLPFAYKDWNEMVLGLKIHSDRDTAGSMLIKMCDAANELFYTQHPSLNNDQSYSNKERELGIEEDEFCRGTFYCSLDATHNYDGTCAECGKKKRQ
jgi:hypothetical protein